MDEKQPLHITLHSAGASSTVVVAKCTRCRLVASRLIDEASTNMAAVVGAEALAALGCAHVEAVTLNRRKTIG
ncbi:MAG TPA: hypothetical protein VGH28_05460 [Polyangiaceae bacterium]|jgi:hypothetical protein